MAGTQFLCSLSGVHSLDLPKLVLVFSSSQRPTRMNRICVWRAETTQWPQHHRGPPYSIFFSHHYSGLDFLWTWISFFQLRPSFCQGPQSFWHMWWDISMSSVTAPPSWGQASGLLPFWMSSNDTANQRKAMLLSDHAVTGAGRDQGSATPQIALHVPCLPLQSFSLRLHLVTGPGNSSTTHFRLS